MKNYIFGGFTLKHGHTLYFHEKLVSLPPKELKVLRLLLDNAGVVVSKEKILMEVWRSDQVSDESLTRCIYVLRRILRESTSTKYIETVYGKGYRFVMRVTKNDSVTIPEKADDFIRVAIFPFQMKSYEKSLLLFDYIQSLGYERTYNHVYFMTSAMTIDNEKFIETYQLLRDAGAHYFITGVEVSTKYRSWIRIEITKSDSMVILWKKKIILDKSFPVTLLQINSAFKDIIRGLSSSIYLSHNYLGSDYDCGTNWKDVLLKDSECGNAHDNAELNPCDTSVICNSIGFYLSLELMGLMQSEEVEGVISDLINNHAPDALGYAMTLSLKALNRKRKNSSTRAQFESAMMLSPFSVEVYFLYACYLVKFHNIDEAKRVIKMIEYINPNFFSAKIFFVSLIAYSGNTEQAIKMAESFKGINKCGDNIMDCLLSLLHHHTNKTINRESVLKSIEKETTHCSFCYNIINFFNSKMSSSGSIKNSKNLLFTY